VLKTLRIARREVFSIFVSPVAWVLVALYVAYASYIYIAALNVATRWQITGSMEPYITSLLFTHISEGVLTHLEPALIVFVPLLTMGVISKERQNGSLKLLMSAPISTLQIVLGKYLAVLMYLLVLFVLLSALVVFSGLIVDHFDYGLVLAGFIGLFLVANVYASIGVFVSSFTNQQMVAAIGTIALLALLRIVGQVGQGIPVVADAAFWLSIDGRFEYLRSGLVSSKDVIYFLLLTLMFLSFAQIVLFSSRVRASKRVQVRNYLGVLGVAVAVGYVTSLHSLTVNLDLTRRGDATLSEGSKDALAEIEGRVRMLVVVNALDFLSWKHNPSQRAKAHREIFDIVEREIGPIDVDYRYYYAQPDIVGAADERSEEALAERTRLWAKASGLDFNRFLSPEEAEKEFQVSLESNRSFYVLQYGGRKAVLRSYIDTFHYPREGHIAAALRTLVDGVRTVAYATGHGERSTFGRGPEDHALVNADRGGRKSLINHGFDFVERSLSEPVPADVDILVLAGPVSALSEDAVRNLRRYVAVGGNLLVMAEPGTDAFLNRALSDVTGVRFERRVPGNGEDGVPEDMVFAELDRNAARLGYQRSFHDVDDPLVMSGAVSLEVVDDVGFSVTPLVSVDSVSGDKANGHRSHEGDKSAKTVSTLLGVALERQVSGRTQRIAIFGDADFMSTSTLRLPVPQFVTLNTAFAHDLFYFLSGDVYPVDTSRPDPIDVTSSLSLRQVDYLGIALIGVIPTLLLALGGALILVRRRA